MVESAQVLQVLRLIKDPELEDDLVSLGFISGIDPGDQKVTIHFNPDTLDCPFLDRLKNEIRREVSKIEGIQEVEVLISGDAQNSLADKGHLPFGEIEHLNHIHKIIAVTSGKCRVRKCLVTGLLAIKLNRTGARVGILDTDITGRNICKMFFSDRPTARFTPRAMLPAQTASGIKVMSLSVLLQNNPDALDYHSPSVIQKIRELLSNVLWGDLDYLIVDMPPGSSDAPAVILQSLAVDGVILVTSPQDLDGLMVKKAATLVQQSGTRILGLVENMSYFQAPESDLTYEVFGPSHIDATAKSLQVPVLARIPVDPGIAVLCDQGKVEECRIPVFEEIGPWLTQNV